MTDHELFTAAYSKMKAPPETLTEVLNMAHDTKKNNVIRFTKRTATLLVAACLVLTLGVTAYATGIKILGWGGNADYEISESDGMTNVTTTLHTDDLKEPVEFKNGRMIFIINGENLDITDEVGENKAYLYQYESNTDGKQITHYILVGQNDSNPENYGFAEFIRDNSTGEWLGGYSARCNLDKGGKGPAWLENGKLMLGIPW